MKLGKRKRSRAHQVGARAGDAGIVDTASRSEERARPEIAAVGATPGPASRAGACGGEFGEQEAVDFLADGSVQRSLRR
jgi:hypothetical protein